ncbi:MAG: GNAT family N-acetyltransferase [Rhodococcus sp. (in: high G+C Gram-positive bacteria)]
MDISTDHEPESHRFVLRLGTDIAAYSEYFDADTVRNFYHTVTLPEHRGRGYAAVLTERALDDTARDGMTVHPSCWFVREFIETNADRYGVLLTSDEPPAAQ